MAQIVNVVDISYKFALNNNRYLPFVQNSPVAYATADKYICCIYRVVQKKIAQSFAIGKF